MNKSRILAIFVIAAVIYPSSGCFKKEQNLEPAMNSITTEELANNVKILSSDEFEGRFPASPGEEKTVNFLKKEFIRVGMKPGNGDSFFQEVPMVEITADPSARLKIHSRNRTDSFTYGDEFMAWTVNATSKESIKNSEMVFVGYGIIAPEYDWNDYEGLDVLGKTVIILINDPGFATKDPDLFNGRAMTYYGRWTYKYEEAIRQGASSALIIHETEPAAYPWSVVKNSWGGTNLRLDSENNIPSPCVIQGWISLETAQKVFQRAGLKYEEMKSSALKKDFKPVELGLMASLKFLNTIRRTRSRNVIGVLPGSGSPDEYIIYMAHWDHFGIDPDLEGDQIYNGALDNATGTSALIELGEAFKKLRRRPSRSVVFLAVTGEEQGLLGSYYYATHPIYPPTKTLAAINMDALNIYGKMRDITVIGYGNSDLDDYVEKAAAEQGRRVRPDPTPEKGSFYRSDHFSFARVGIPALYTSSGIDHIVHGEKWTLEKKGKYTMEHYHKPSDEFDPNWDLSGAIDDLRLLFKIGCRLCQTKVYPNWKEGTEFKALRDSAMEVTAEK